MAVGTVASRATGFVRTVVLASVLGTALLGNAYVTANTIPNIVYELLLGGILTSVVVPMLVQADSTGSGEHFAQRFLSLTVFGLGALSVVLVLAAPVVIDVYGGSFTPAQRDLAVLFARFFLPQVFFYGVGAVLGAILNTRGEFAAPMWAPVANNVVVVLTGLLFAAAAPAASRVPGSLSQEATVLLAAGTTLGIVTQTVVLVPRLRAVGFRLRIRRDVRGAGLGRAWRLGRWMLVYVAANQLGLVVLVALANAAAASSRTPGGDGAGYATYAYAFQLFLLPHAVVGVSVFTALLPRMSAAASGGRLADLRADLSRGTRIALVALVPSAAVMLAFHDQIGVLVFGRGAISIDEARAIGAVLGAFAFGLVPFSLFQLQLRAFYAMSDTRTPALINVVVNVVNVAGALALYTALPPSQRVIGIAAAYSLSYAVGFTLSTRSLATKAGRQRGTGVMRIAARLVVSATAAAAVGAVVADQFAPSIADGPGRAFITLGIGCGIGGVVFLLVAWKAGVAEVQQFLRLLWRVVPL